mmetsp:Transcript_37253/g.116488  ORF Transcript_37253/g.116488 Transcript_37253/m.116488 type:complete len:161 (-) Transcript_37253:352-834(-)
MQSFAEAGGATDPSFPDKANGGRTPAAYNYGFFGSKFCLVIPGDTLSTSQGARALCGGCVPVFVVSEFRDLPFASILEYGTFALRVQPREVTTATTATAEGMGALVERLRELIRSGAYERLRENAWRARDFFNYYRFSLRSPYGAALASIVTDENRRLAS